MKERLLLLTFTLFAISNASSEPSRTLQELDALIRQNELKLKALEGVRLYADKNRLTRLSSGHIDELSNLY
jgi:hypothetical protein